jgi:hypothetical protein
MQAAFAEAYAGVANTSEFLVFMNEYPLENAFSGGRLQSDNPRDCRGNETAERSRRMNSQFGGTISRLP